MPQRSDKRDALTLLASVTGIQIEYVDGVDGATIAGKTIPKVEDFTNSTQELISIGLATRGQQHTRLLASACQCPGKVW